MLCKTTVNCHLSSKVKQGLSQFSVQYKLVISLNSWVSNEKTKVGVIENDKT